MDNRPIGVFDSGVGGLTVVKELISQLPNESIVYFGDTARVPYGTKSVDTVTKYSLQNIRFLLTHNIKAIIVACNTVSAVSLDVLKNQFDIPIIGVIRPGSVCAVNTTINKRIGIIGTQATVSSKAYENAIKQLCNDILTFGVACSMFVPLVEEGWVDNQIAYKIAEEYLKELNDKDIDSLILGCTHYPLLKSVIKEVMGNNIELINPAYETAKDVKNILKQKDMLRKDKTSPQYNYYLSDTGAKFESIADICLNNKIGNIQKIDIEKY